MTASAYDYASHAEPQGLTIRPLLSTITDKLYIMQKKLDGSSACAAQSRVKSALACRASLCPVAAMRTCKRTVLSS